MTPSVELWLASAHELRVVCARWDGRGSVRGCSGWQIDHDEVSARPLGWVSAVRDGRRVAPGATEAIREERRKRSRALVFCRMNDRSSGDGCVSLDARTCCRSS